MIEILVVVLLQGMSITLSVERMYGIKTIEECNRVLPEVVKKWDEVEGAYCVRGDINYEHIRS